MKKLVTLFTLMAGASLSFGQAVTHGVGSVQFVNNEAGAGQPDHRVYLNAIASANRLIGTQYKVELYVYDTNASSFVPVPATLSSFKSTTVTATTQWGQWAGPSAAIALPTNAAFQGIANNIHAGEMGGIDYIGGIGESAVFGGNAQDTTIPIPNHDNYDAPGYYSKGGDGYYPLQAYVVAWDSTTGSDYAHATIKGQSAIFTYTQRFGGGVGGTVQTSDNQMVTQPAFALVPEPSAIALSVLGVAGLLLIRRRK